MRCRWLIGLGVAFDWHARPLLKAAIVLNLAYWVFGQGFGGIFQGGATDPNSGPLFVLFACVLYALLTVQSQPRVSSVHHRARSFVGHANRGKSMNINRRPTASALGRWAAVTGCWLRCAAACGLRSGGQERRATTAKPKHKSAMVSMNMGSATTAGTTVAPTIKGIKPVPTQVLSSTKWQGMDISAEAMTAVPFVVFNGTQERRSSQPARRAFT